MAERAPGNNLVNESKSELLKFLMRLEKSGRVFVFMEGLDKIMKQKIEKPPTCDILIDDHVINCRLFILQYHSRLFKYKLKPNDKFQINSDYCSVGTFKTIYRCMMECRLSGNLIKKSNVLDIYRASKYLRITGFNYMDNERIFNEDTAFRLYREAKEKKCDEIVSIMLPRIQISFLCLVGSEDWVKLDIEGVKDILTSNYIRINCEMEVFAAAVIWLKHDVNGRWSQKDELFACVRFGHIDDWQLEDIKTNSTSPDYLLLASDPAINKMINDGIAYANIEKHCKDEAIRLSLLEELNLSVPAPRNWTGVKQIHSTFDSFLLFLDAYKEECRLKRRRFREERKYTTADLEALMPLSKLWPSSPLRLPEFHIDI